MGQIKASDGTLTPVTDITKVRMELFELLGTGLYKLRYEAASTFLQRAVDVALASTKNLADVADIPTRDALILNVDFNIGNMITVLNNGFGEKVKYQYIYDNNIADYGWVEIGLLSNIQTG